MAPPLPMLRPFLIFVLLFFSPLLAGAQSPPSGGTDSFGGSYTVKVNPAVAAIVMSLILLFFFLGFFSVYFRRCGSRGSSSSRSDANTGEGYDAARRAGGRGLDNEVLETFPTMAYAKAKELKSGEDEALECAVCLSEFASDDVLRLLPRCSHVFHVDCIDVWLNSHVTCPVCRSNLADPPAESAAATPNGPADGVADLASAEEGSGDLDARSVAGMRRWNSTGHEAGVDRGTDRFTLRLPEHVQREILAAGRYRRASSLTVVPDVEDASVRRSGGGGFGGLSGRWRSLWRTMSMRRWAADAEAPQPAGPVGSSKRIFPTADEAPLQIRVEGGGADGNESGSSKKDPSSMTPSV